MGAYMCIARNGVPPAVSKTVQLSVNCKVSSDFRDDIWVNAISSSAPDLLPHSVDRGQAPVRAESLLRGWGLAITDKLLDIRDRRDDCCQWEVHYRGEKNIFSPTFSEMNTGIIIAFILNNIILSYKTIVATHDD